MLEYESMNKLNEAFGLIREGYDILYGLEDEIQEYSDKAAKKYNAETFEEFIKYRVLDIQIDMHTNMDIRSFLGILNTLEDFKELKEQYPVD